MKLSRLLYRFYDSSLYTDVEITGLALDSRTVKPGDLFFACQGTKVDGRLFIDDAIRNGAKAILEDVTSTLTPVRSKDNVPIFPMDHVAQHIGSIAAEFYDNPSKKLNIIGITGTNGKTSTSYFIAQALEFCQVKCGVIGTLGTGLYGKINEGHLTTPDAITLQKLLNDFVHQRAKAVSMEVSSHSLDQGRVNGIDFAIGIFTNLTRDHLDYHGSMDEYGKAKQKLFNSEFSRFAVINRDDPFGEYLLAQRPAETTYAYSLNPPKDKSHCIYADSIRLEPTGIRSQVYSPWGAGELFTPLIGQFNLSNILATIATLCLLKIPFEEAMQAMGHLSPVPGRMQTVGGGDKPLIVVDYAHTPDALEKVLSALKYHCQGRLLCVFGCGGDRDRGKRPLMATIAERYADYIIVTDDNPRTEDPEAIVKDIMTGFTHPEKVNIQHNRSKAIADIIQYAHSNDYVVIAGKGAETYQQIGSKKIPFSDIQEVMETLNARMVE